MKAVAAGLLALLVLQDPPPGNGGYSTDSFGPIYFRDEKGAIEGTISGRGSTNFDPKTETGELVDGDLTYYLEPGSSKAGTSKAVTRKIQLLFNRCNLGRIEKGDQNYPSFRCTGGLRGFLDEDVRFWTEEAPMDYLTKVIHCPKPIRLVHYDWPQEFDLATFLAFLGPKESSWIHLVGGPRPDLVLLGDDLQVDTASNLLTVTQKGHLVVMGNPKPEGRRKESKRPAPPDLRTDLRCEGPLRIRGLSNEFAESHGQYHVTAEREVVLERALEGRIRRARADSASMHVAIRRGAKGEGIRTTLLSVSLRGGIRLEDGHGIVATADRMDWNHQEDLLRLRGEPRVDVVQGEQRLLAREVTFDRWTGLVSFEGDIEATIRPEPRPAKSRVDPLGAPIGLGPLRTSGKRRAEPMTLKPTRLEVKTSKGGGPAFLRAWDGVRITGSLGAAGPEPIEAEGNSFEWDLATESGVLRGKPWARIVRGSQQVYSPLVTFEGESFMVIKGPSLVKFRFEKPLETSAAAFEAALGLRGLHAIPGRATAVEDVSVTSDRDIVFDHETGLVKLVEGAVIRTQDSSLTADRLYVVLQPRGSRPDRILGYGRVSMSMAARPKSPAIRANGEVVDFRPTAEQVMIYGQPLARVVRGLVEAFAETIRYDLKTGTTEVTNVEIHMPGQAK